MTRTRQASRVKLPSHLVWTQYERVIEFNRAERKIPRELADEVYEPEAREILADLAASFAEWRKRKRLSSDLLADIHAFHQHDSRELWATYQGLDEAQVLARGVAFGFIPPKKVPAEIAKKLNVEQRREIARRRGSDL